MRWSSPPRVAIVAALLAVAGVLQPQMTGDIPHRAGATPSPVPSPSPEAPRGSALEFFVMIDPSHGGDDPGARLGPSRVPEKDIALALARQLKRQLEERGIAARLLRDSDISLSLEQRAALSNEQHAGLYIALHAGQPGKGIRVYAPAPWMTRSSSAGRFLPWESAQMGSLERSRLLAGLVAGELRKTGLSAAALGASLRPLNNVLAPAIAVEWDPGPEDLRSPQTQRLENMLVSGIAAAILAAHNQEGGGARL